MQIFTRILIIAVLPLLSGAAALSHELLWTRRLIDLLGATDWVVGRVLGLFFLGISLGGYLATKFQSENSSPLFRLAITELLIGILALPAAFLPAWMDWIWPTLGTELLVSWQGALIKLAVAAIVVLPPAIAMGFTLPLFVKAATNMSGDVASVGVWIYALNTLGGVFGLWSTSTFLIQWLGAQSAMLAVVSINLFVAFAAFVLARASGTRNVQDEVTSTTDLSNNQASPPFSNAQILALSFLSGLFVLSMEILILRLIALVAPSSYHTTSAMLANVILILAIGSLFISALNRFFNPNHWPLIIGLLGAAGCCCFCPLVLYQQTDQLIALKYLQMLNGRTIESIGHYWMLLFWLVASAGGAALLFSGLVFPALLSLSSEDDPSGNRIGQLLAVNGIGGLIGSESINSIVIPLIGIYLSFLLLGTLIATVAFVLLWKVNRELAIGAICATALVIFLAYDNISDIPYISPQTTAKYKIKSTLFGPEGVSHVVNDAKGSKSILMNNQYLLGSSGVATDERRQLLLPWLFNSDAKTVCSLGLATGISVGGLESVDNPPAITAVELSANVVELAKSHFQSESRGFFERSENRVIIEDARTFIAAANNQFDLIVADLFRPHGTGEGRLFSQEHYQNVRRAMTDNGIYCHWLPLHQLNEANFNVIAATFLSEFPETLVVFGNADVGIPVLGLVARKSNEKWEAEFLEKQLVGITPKMVQDDPLLQNARALIIGKLKKDAYSKLPLNTLDNLSIEIAAGNFWILKDLRRDRPPAKFEDEFLSKNNLVDFVHRLQKNTTPVFPGSHNNRFVDLLKANYSASR